MPRLAAFYGVTRNVDCSFLLRGLLGEPLRDPSYFRQVRVDEQARTVVWPNGLDPAPELLTVTTTRRRASSRAIGLRAHGEPTTAFAGI
ncbi:MAG: DUF2442 domain-containing protein [Gaiellaceae bacterium MAG52_C11]|nr:DUF2442 domain-containing protein [Candidatus Gaiellasilicea maunaloa]